MPAHPALHTLLSIPEQPDTVATRGGHYAPDHNVWIAADFAAQVAAMLPEDRTLTADYADLALAAGALHRRQIADARNGRLWPQAWLDAKDGDALIAFCRANPNAASPYSTVATTGQVVPFSHAYHPQLHEVRQALARAVQRAAPSARQQAAYLHALLAAYTYDPQRAADQPLMDAADVAWVQTPADIPLLLLAEFSENYSDPLKPLVVNQPAVTEWARAVTADNGVGPWKFFFEMRLMSAAADVVSQAEIQAIRDTNARLYAAVSDALPNPNVKTEFRRMLLVAGHGANPPKSAKNYPNQGWIRAEHGYRSIIYANQVAAAVEAEIVPALRAAFPTDWAQRPTLTDAFLRARALYLVAHEETHPWATFQEMTWLEEMKCDVLGMWSLLQTDAIADDLADIVLSAVADALLMHRYHHFLLARSDGQFEDYYIGDTIFMAQLFRSGYFRTDNHGMVVDISPDAAAAAVTALAQRILTVRRREETPQALLADLYDPALYDRFHGWQAHQPYFEALWST